MAPLTTWSQIAAFINTTVERADLDFKSRLPAPTKPFELAKDVAALANGLGGSIVVGASTQGKFLCTGLPGIPVQDAINLSADFERAAGDRCRPRVVLDCAVIRLPSDPSNAVLSVNVAASGLVPVGVDLREKGDADTWKFPLRTTSQTVWLSPDQFGAFENMTARRSGALLASIPLAEREQVTIREERSHRRPQRGSVVGGDARHRGSLVGCLVDVDYRANVAHFMMAEKAGDARSDFRVPLDWVATTWRDNSTNQWIVLVDCVFHRTEERSWAVARLETTEMS